jgi:hypothetical protein
MQCDGEAYIQTCGSMGTWQSSLCSGNLYCGTPLESATVCCGALAGSMTSEEFVCGGI